MQIQYRPNIIGYSIVGKFGFSLFLVRSLNLLHFRIKFLFRKKSFSDKQLHSRVHLYLVCHQKLREVDQFAVIKFFWLFTLHSLCLVKTQQN